MKKCCLMCANIFRCHKQSKTSALKLIEEGNLLLPKTESTRGIIERNELNSYGNVPDEIKGIIDLTLYTNSIVQKITCSNGHCLILMKDKSLFCFGNNSEGQLGITIKDNKLIPSLFKHNLILLKEMIGNFTIEDIGVGDNYSLLLLKDKTSDIMHLIKFGLLEEDKYICENIDNVKIVHIVNIPNVPIKEMIVFGKRILLLTATNDIYLGGMDFESGLLEDFILFTQFDKQIQSIHLGSSHCIIFTIEGLLYGVGDNTYGELGSGEMNQFEFKEIHLKDLNNNPIKKITTGARHTMILLSNGEVYCIGDNSEGQCFGFNTRIVNPVKIDLGYQSKVIDIYSGYSHNLFILENGDILTWGNSSNGKLGYKHEHFSQATPKLILQLQERCPYNVSLGSEMTIISTASNQISLMNHKKNASQIK